MYNVLLYLRGVHTAIMNKAIKLLKKRKHQNFYSKRCQLCPGALKSIDFHYYSFVPQPMLAMFLHTPHLIS